jgi:hypothetical protein
MGVPGGSNPSSTLIASALGMESQLRPRFGAVHFLRLRFCETDREREFKKETKEKKEDF